MAKLRKYIVREYRHVLIEFEIEAKSPNDAADKWDDGNYPRPITSDVFSLEMLDGGFHDVRLAAPRKKPGPKPKAKMVKSKRETGKRRLPRKRNDRDSIVDRVVDGMLKNMGH